MVASRGGWEQGLPGSGVTGLWELKLRFPIWIGIWVTQVEAFVKTQNATLTMDGWRVGERGSKMIIANIHYRIYMDISVLTVEFHQLFHV